MKHAGRLSALLMLAACSSPQPPPASTSLAIQASFGGIPPWAPNGILSVGDAGAVEFRKYRTDSGKTLAEEKTLLTPAQMKSIADAVRANGFFDLKPLYDGGAHDGSYCHLEVVLDGRKHAVTTRNQAVKAFDDLCRAINRELPESCRIFYNEIAR